MRLSAHRDKSHKPSLDCQDSTIYYPTRFETILNISFLPLIIPVDEIMYYFHLLSNQLYLLTLTLIRKDSKSVNRKEK